MSKLNTVIFDMDGVIIDSEPLHYKVSHELFAELNIKITKEEYNTFIGVSNPDMWSYLKDKYNLKESVSQLLSRLSARNIEYLKNKNEKPIAGVLDLLASLQKEKIKIGLASSSEPSYIDLVLSKFEIKDYFEVIVSGENFAKSKPCPDIFLYTAEKLQAEPAECVVIEDSHNGVKAAKRAGMSCVGFQNVNSGNQDLTEADIIVDSMDKVNISLLKNLF